MVIDLKRMMNIAGIQTQGRGTHAQWVSSYDVSVSSDGINWKNLGVKTGNTDQSSKVNNLFQERARYVKIAVVRMHSHASMRGDVLLSKTQDPLPSVTLANSDPAQYSFSDVHSSCSNVAQIDSSDGWSVLYFATFLFFILIYGTGALQAVLQDSWLSISRGS